MKDRMTIGELYMPAMELETREEADAYFEKLVERCIRGGKTREEAEKIERSNLGYFAGYYSHETRQRVERLFSCAHPVFGSIDDNGPPTATEAFRAGLERGEKLR